VSPLKTPTRTLTSILVECGIVTDAQVERALVRQRETGHFIGESLVELGFTSEENIGWALSKQLGIPYADVHAQAVDPDLVKDFPEGLLRRVQAIPLFGTAEEITIAMADPGDRDAVAELESATGANLSLVIGGPGSIRRALDTIYGRATSDFAEPGARATAAETTPSAGGPPLNDVVWDRAGTSFLLYHLHAARQRGASEIQFVPHEGHLEVYYRTDSGLEAQSPERVETGLFLRARLGVLGIPDLEDPRALFTRGFILVEVGGQTVAVTASHCRTPAGVVTVLRVSPRRREAPALESFGLSPIGEAEIREMMEGPEGIVIVHGPPRSGGSTLVASIAALAAREDRRTLVLEPTHAAPYPPRATRIAFDRPDVAAASWEGLVAAQGADVAVLDDVLRGEAIERILAPASVGRLVLARTDWLDAEALLEVLSRTRADRFVLRDRPIALVTLPAARYEGSAVWAEPEQAERRAGSIEVRLLTDEDRDALSRGPR
jgi:type II secretion system (T2SS) protein E/type II/IV secretion system protein